MKTLWNLKMIKRYPLRCSNKIPSDTVNAQKLLQAQFGMKSCANSKDLGPFFMCYITSREDSFRVLSQNISSGEKHICQNHITYCKSASIWRLKNKLGQSTTSEADFMNLDSVGNTNRSCKVSPSQELNLSLPSQYCFGSKAIFDTLWHKPSTNHYLKTQRLEMKKHINRTRSDVSRSTD